jgi:F0F1-type ATP synthase assembly protein I
MVVDRLQNMWNDVKTSKYILLGAVLFAFVVSLLFIYFVDKFAGCLVWSLIGAIIGMMLLFAYSAYAKYA